MPGQRAAVPPRLVARVGTVLAGWPGEWVDRDRLISELWGDRPPRTALNTLQAHISQLRKVVGKDLVLGDANGYLLDVEPTSVDAEEFAELTQEAARAQRQMHLGRAHDLLTQALDLWHGIPYCDVEDGELLARRARLEEMWRIAQEDLLECKLRLAQDSHQVNDVIGCAKERVTLEPLRERRHVLLIHALDRANRQAEATAALDDAVNQIRTITGTDPGPQLSEAVFDAAEAFAPRSARSVSSGRRAPHDVTDISENLLASVVETLVVHDIPTMVACLPETEQLSFAELAASRMADDFPLGIHITSAEEVDTGFGDAERGSLHILVNTDESTIVRVAESRSRVDGALLLLASAPPKQRVLIPVLSATAPEDLQLLRTS